MSVFTYVVSPACVTVPCRAESCMDTHNFFAEQWIWRDEASLVLSAKDTQTQHVFLLCFCSWNDFGMMWWVGCALYYLSQLSGQVANELLPTLNGKPVPLGSLRCQLETGLDISGVIPLGNQKVRYLLVLQGLCSGRVYKESRERRRMRREFWSLNWSCTKTINKISRALSNYFSRLKA